MAKKTVKKSNPKDKILKALEASLKHLAADGGGVEIVKVDQKKGVVEIRMTGGCCGCPFRDLTFAKMIADRLKEKISWIKDVKLVK